MSTRVCEVAVIGAGTAGMVAWRAARERSDSVVLIEGDRYGTTCARIGCMPSKLLIAAGNAAHAVREAPGFGVHPGTLRIDGAEVMARVRAERDRFVGFVLDTINEIPPEDRLRGHARFIDPNTLSLGQSLRLEANRIIIATGSAPVMPEAVSALGARVDTNESIFEWKDLPESVAVLGAGVIGLELGQALARLGVRVSIFGRGGGLAAITDPEVRAAAHRALGRELNLQLHANVREASLVDDRVMLRYDGAEGLSTASFDRVLVATGRRPRVEALALENSGLALDPRGQPMNVDPVTGQCGQSHIFIAGDVSGDRPLLHEAAYAGRIAGINAAHYPDVRAFARKVPMSVVFCEPQVVRVGESHTELCARKAAFVTGEVRFENQGRARVIRENAGLLHVYAEHGSGLLLGAEMVAPRAEHLAHLLAWAIEARLTVTRALDMPFYHPVIEEGLRTALQKAARALRMAPPPAPQCLDCGPGA